MFTVGLEKLCSTPSLFRSVAKSTARAVGQNQRLFAMQNQPSGIKSALFKAHIK